MPTCALSRRTCLSLAVLGSATLPACIGSFALTRKLYNFNIGMQGRWIRWLVFLLFFVLGVYGFCAFLDALVLNTLEFWTGKTPLSAQHKSLDDPTRQVKIQDAPRRGVVIDLYEGRQRVARLVLHRDEEGLVLQARQPSGAGRAYRVHDEGNREQRAATIVDAQGHALARFAPDAAQHAMDAIAAGHAPLLVMQASLLQQGPKRARV